MILESDSVWKDDIERKLQGLEDAVGKIANHLSLPEMLEPAQDQGECTVESHNTSGSAHLSPQTEKHTPYNFEIVMDPESGPAEIPGSVVSSIAVPVAEQNRGDQDLISRGIITLEQAQSYLDIYQNRLDHFLYRIIGDRRTLSQVRTASPLLLSAICAVGSLHLVSPQFEQCYQEFVAIASARTFSRRNNVDDIRGLCIGAFWLSGISWACAGAAVRISTEIQLHRSIFKALTGDRTHYLRTRLYYLVWICDHHFSIVYGRPPMTRQDDTIRACSQFLKTPNAVEDDARLVSQIQRWMIGSDIHETFGVDVERPLDLSMVRQLRHHSIRLDKIRAEWTERFSYNDYVGNYPAKGVQLHYHFAKLYLTSLAFRGIGRPEFKAPEVALDIDEIANSAVLAATEIIRAVISDTEIQTFLNGLPTYFDVMIAFAVVFVLKVSSKYATFVRVDTSEIYSLVAELVTVLRAVTMSMHPRHLLVSVAKGAEDLLQKCTSQDIQGPGSSSVNMTTWGSNAPVTQPSTVDEGLYDMSSAWNANAFDDFFMGEFDFLSTQNAYNNFQLDSQF